MFRKSKRINIEDIAFGYRNVIDRDYHIYDVDFTPAFATNQDLEMELAVAVAFALNFKLTCWEQDIENRWGEQAVLYVDFEQKP